MCARTLFFILGGFWLVVFGCWLLPDDFCPTEKRRE